MEALKLNRVEVIPYCGLLGWKLNRVDAPPVNTHCPGGNLRPDCCNLQFFRNTKRLFFRLAGNSTVVAINSTILCCWSVIDAFEFGQKRAWDINLLAS